MNWWVSNLWQADRMLLVAWVLWVIVSIVLHELAHGWAAIRCGDNTPRELGHMTWNPLVHIPPMSWLFFALAGCCYGLMPVDPSRFRGRYDDAIVSGAGPAMNLLLSIVAAIATVLWERLALGNVPPHVFDNTQTLLRVGVGLNLFLMLFNLIPIPPLDGSSILSTFVPAYRRFWQGEKAAVIGLVAFVLLFSVGSSSIFGVAMGMGRNLIDTLDTLAAPLLGRPPATP